MEYEIKYKPSYSMLVVKLDPNESITAEAGAMTYMDPTVEAQTRRREKRHRTIELRTRLAIRKPCLAFQFLSPLKKLLLQRT